jgi:UDP:flavonoid glycosyltransferase YjiC (YdhE family)
MKVLCSTTSGAGHWIPLLPVAQALEDAGHTVVFACPDTAAEAIGNRGFEARPFDEVLERTEEQLELFRQAEETRNPMLAERAIALGFGLISPRAAFERLERTVLDFQPDLVVRDPSEFASMVLAEQHEVASIVAVGGLQSALSFLLGLVDEHVRQLRQESGASPRDTLLSDRLVCTATPPGFDLPGDHGVPVIRYGLSAPLTPTPTDQPPMVYATLGTEVMKHPMGRGLLEAIIGALSGLEVRALVTSGVEPDELGLSAIPDHVEVRRFADHRQVIPASRAVVTHAGAGTVQDALLMGRPIVALPQFADQFLNADRITESGVGTMLVGPDQTPDQIADRVSDALDGAFDAAVDAIAAEAQELPSLADLLPTLEAASGRLE